MLFLLNSAEPSKEFGAAWRETEAQEGVALVKLFVDNSQLTFDFAGEVQDLLDAREDEEWTRTGC